MGRTDRVDGIRSGSESDPPGRSRGTSSPAKWTVPFGVHYRRPHERPFTAEERTGTTILVGGLTQKHEALLRAVFERNGFRMKSLPDSTKKSFRTGKEYCNNGLCNPVYYTAGTLIRYLRELKAAGQSTDQIKEDYLYLTLSDCGPCRFGLYESEYRQALQHAGFEGFRVITSQLNRASKTGGKRPGLDFSLDQWFDIVNALIVGDLLYGVAYQIRPYEISPGDTDRALDQSIAALAGFFSSRSHFEIRDRLPGILRPWVTRRPTLVRWLSGIGKFRHHFYDRKYMQLLRECGERLASIPVDRTNPRPVVKIVGEFYSRLSETDANYKMFQFLEDEGAEVCVGSIGGVLQYWFFKSRRDLLQRRDLDPPFPDPSWFHFRRRWKNWKASALKPLIFYLIDRVSTRQYSRLSSALGGFARVLPPQEELAGLAEFYYRPLTRGGEGHLEVAESIHCTIHHEAHMSLSLKPFGCMPSTQSDGVMATVSTHFEEMLFASIETTGDSDINAYSRVQMVLADAHRRAVKEFEDALDTAGRTLESIQEYLAARPELSRAGYRLRRFPGVTGTAANYVLQVGELMDRESRVRGGTA